MFPDAPILPVSTVYNVIWNLKSCLADTDSKKLQISWDLKFIFDL